MQPVRGRKIWENRLSLPVTLRFNVNQFRLSDRNLLEHRIRNSGVRSNRYRNRFQVEHPVGHSLSLFVADEVFYDWSVDRWVRNRFSIGASKVFNKHFTQDFFYLRQNDGVSVPGDLNVIGTILRFRLKFHKKGAKRTKRRKETLGGFAPSLRLCVKPTATTSRP